MKGVNLTQITQKIEVFYDGQCGMCKTFIAWLIKQQHVIEVVCYDFHGEEAERVFAELKEHDPGRELVVRVDGCRVYKGAEGWVCCLWACEDYRKTAKRINSCFLLPMAKKVCHLVSNNRLTLSQLFFRKKNKEIIDEIETKHKKDKKMNCEGGCE